MVVEANIVTPDGAAAIQIRLRRVTG